MVIKHCGWGVHAYWSAAHTVYEGIVTFLSVAIMVLYWFVYSPAPAGENAEAIKSFLDAAWAPIGMLQVRSLCACACACACIVRLHLVYTGFMHACMLARAALHRRRHRHRGSTRLNATHRPRTRTSPFTRATCAACAPQVCRIVWHSPKLKPVALGVRASLSSLSGTYGRPDSLHHGAVFSSLWFFRFFRCASRLWRVMTDIILLLHND